MPTVGVYLKNETYIKLVQIHGRNIGKVIAALADKEAAKVKEG